jgi:hypothetical protein
MAAIRRENLLDCLRKLEEEWRRCRQEAAQRDVGSTVTHGYLGVVDGIEFCPDEIMVRFGIRIEEIEQEPVRPAPEQSAEDRPEKKMASSKGEESQERKRKTS